MALFKRSCYTKTQQTCVPVALEICILDNLPKRMQYLNIQQKEWESKGKLKIVQTRWSSINWISSLGILGLLSQGRLYFPFCWKIFRLEGQRKCFYSTWNCSAFYALKVSLFPSQLLVLWLNFLTGFQSSLADKLCCVVYCSVVCNQLDFLSLRKCLNDESCVYTSGLLELFHK